MDKKCSYCGSTHITKLYRNRPIYYDDGSAIFDTCYDTRIRVFNGKIHNEHGPAVTSDCGVEEWWYNGQKHRPRILIKDKGYEGYPDMSEYPTVIYPNGYKQWWYKGVLISSKGIKNKHNKLQKYASYYDNTDEDYSDDDTDPEEEEIKYLEEQNLIKDLHKNVGDYLAYTAIEEMINPVLQKEYKDDNDYYLESENTFFGASSDEEDDEEKTYDNDPFCIGVRPNHINNEITVTKVLKNGLLHNDNGPAWITTEFVSWWKEGRLHRDNDLPAVIFTKSGAKEWWFEGLRHRSATDKFGQYLPAFICKSEKITQWWYNGLCHRFSDLPAVITPDAKYWLRYGKLHRENDKPAIIQRNKLSWYKFNQKNREYDYPTFIVLNDEYAFKNEIPDDTDLGNKFVGFVDFVYGDLIKQYPSAIEDELYAMRYGIPKEYDIILYHKHDHFHRKNGLPAEIRKDNVVWWQYDSVYNGKFPSEICLKKGIIWTNEQGYINREGLLPARISSKEYEFYENGVRRSFTEFLKKRMVRIATVFTNFISEKIDHYSFEDFIFRLTANTSFC